MLQVTRTAEPQTSTDALLQVLRALDYAMTELGRNGDDFIAIRLRRAAVVVREASQVAPRSVLPAEQRVLSRVADGIETGAHPFKNAGGDY
jgi:hypothetical protein